jgi:hypothetical protein
MTDSLWIRRVVILVAVGVIVGLAGTLAVQIVRANDDLTSKLASFEVAEIPPEQNAADWLMAGASAVVWSDDDLQAIGEASHGPSSEWGPELTTSVRAALDRQRGALETLHRAALLDRSSYGIDYSEGVRAEMPDLLSLIKACRLLLAEARVAAADGDRELAITSLRTMGRMAASLERESAILTALVGVACERMMLRAAAEVLVCDQQWIDDPTFVDALGDTLSTEDLAAMMHRVFDAWTLVETKAFSEQAESAEAWVEAGVTASDIERAAAILHELVDTPYGSAPERFTEPMADDALGTVLANIREAIPRHQATLAQRQLVRAAVDLRRTALGDGAYPSQRSSIQGLTRPDPFTARPLAYSVRDDRSAQVGLSGADELLEQVVLKSAAHVPPIELPAP